MWAIWTLTAMIAVAGYFSVAASVQQPPAVSVLSVDLAGNMGIYRQAVLDYVRGHPSASGTVPDGSLTFPSWYTRNPLWTNTVTGGNIIVYPTAAPPAGFVQEMITLARSSLMAGTANQTTGTLHSPLAGDTGIALPAGIPDGRPVWLATIN